MAFLTITYGEHRRVHELHAVTYVGRGTQCEILLDDPRSSKKHLEIKRLGDRYLLKDLNSTNGTFYGHERLIREISLKDGDELTIGETRLVFTRSLPPSAEKALENAREKKIDGGTALVDKTGLRLEEVPSQNVPKGTMVVPLERFKVESLDSLASAKIAEDPDLGAAFGLRALYQLLREANQCESEEDLLGTTYRVLSECFPGCKVRILFEASDDPTQDVSPEHLNLTIWKPINHPGYRPTRLLDRQLAEARTALLSHARERCVALLSPDIELDESVQEIAATGELRTTTLKSRKELESKVDRERLSILIAPLVSRRTCLGYLFVERSYIPNRGKYGEPLSGEQLEFLAAAAYPLATLLANLRRHQNIRQQNEKLKQSLAGTHRIIGAAPALKAVLHIVDRVAPHKSPVLIMGESGTGKELIARAIHELSPRRNGPFEALNCAALPEQLIESELFGHARGSFTGATGDRAGYFEISSGGTLFLDEVGELPAQAQAKLLRVLEESKLARVGESRLRDIDCRIVTATNRDLAAEVEAGNFRRDLYYRLRVMDISLPPLRERLEDLPLLCEHFLSGFGHFLVHPEVYEIFKRYPWPGNIRELRNTLERMAVLSRGVTRGMVRGGLIALTANDVPLDIREAIQQQSSTDEKPMEQIREAPTHHATTIVSREPGFTIPNWKMLSLEQLQVEYAKWILTQVDNNKSKAAKILGIQRSTLYSWTEWGRRKEDKAGAAEVVNDEDEV